MSNRRERRWPRRIQVRFWRRGKPEETFHGFTSDLSENGAFIVTTTPVGTNSRIRVELLAADGGFVAEAVVRRSRRVHRELQAVRSSGMGIRFLGIAELIRELLPDVDSPNGELAQPGEPPAEEEPVDDEPEEVPATATSDGLGEPAAAAQVSSPTGSAPELQLPVRFRSVDDLREIHDRDLQHGGLFLTTPKPAPVGTRIRLALHLPGVAEPLLADARVVQVFEPPARAPAAPNQPVGMGLLFDDPSTVLSRVLPLLQGSRSAI